jgi:predicted ATPase
MGRGILGQLAVETGDASLGLEMLSGFHEMLRAQRYGLLLAVFSAPLAQALASLGRTHEALEVIEFALSRVEQGGGSFDFPELLRIKATLLAAISGPDTPQAEQLLQRSIGLARSQATLAWELRATMSLAGLRLQQGRPAEALPQLQSVLDRFTEGRETTDLIRARRMLDEPKPRQGAGQ